MHLGKELHMYSLISTLLYFTTTNTLLTSFSIDTFITKQMQYHVSITAQAPRPAFLDIIQDNFLNVHFYKAFNVT